VSPKPFVRQVRTALARETDAFRPATHAVRPQSFVGQVIAALARAPIAVVPEPAPSADDIADPSQEGHTESAEPVKPERPPTGAPVHVPEQPQIRHTESRHPQIPTPRGARARASRSLLTVAEVASRLGISKMAVYRLIHSGELAAIRVGRTFRVPEVVVEEMAAELQRHSGTA